MSATHATQQTNANMENRPSTPVRQIVRAASVPPAIVRRQPSPPTPKRNAENMENTKRRLDFGNVDNLPNIARLSIE